MQFTPRVAVLDEAVLLEVAASRRLFGGEAALRERLCAEAQVLGCEAVAWGPTARAALAFARAGWHDGDGSMPLTQRLDRLPLHTVSELAREQATLVRLGCKTLGDVRRLPRGGLSRRFGKALLEALDQAYGLRPQAFEWLVLPERFETRLQLPSRVEDAQALVFGARRLLMQMSGWLAARHAGVRRFTFVWHYDFHRGRDAPERDELQIRTADLTRETSHFERLLSEHLAKTTLAAPVDDIRLCADEVEPLEEVSASLLQDPARGGESVTQLIERVSARLGADKVLRPVLRADHRPEHVQTWQPAGEAGLRKPVVALPALLPQPTWLLATPLRLAMQGQRPMYQGVLETVAGPCRLEAGWWDRDRSEAGETAAVARDYYVMFSAHAGLLWVYKERDVGAQGRNSPWFLHGIFG
ncbi:DNA polymerase [Caldimonas brevitalea]|uniref:DNA polymerase n=1 Tax=Caldimonas brevitalea TaxID=413882 RepID=A0A0G3BQF9_9BURK|nr:DNA polymerase [Caldimonas brevitalea]